jgi:transmembrane sensor
VGYSHAEIAGTLGITTHRERLPYFDVLGNGGPRMTAPQTPHSSETDAKRTTLRVLAEAAAWKALLTDTEHDPHIATEYLRWSKACETHQVAAELADEIWDEMGDLLQTDSARPSTTALFPETRASFPRHEGRSCGKRDAKTRPTTWQSRPRSVLLPILAAITVLLPRHIHRTQDVRTYATATHHQTGIGERTSVSLTDQSLVHLNAQTSILIQETSHGRKITLNSGEILADVRHDETRPFEVLVNNSVIRDIGTRFDVTTHNGTTDVSVASGQVRIYQRQTDGQLIDPIAGTSPNKDRTPILLKEGDVARLEERKGAVLATLTSPASDISKHHSIWLNDEVSFEGWRLDEIVKELNRYNRDQVVIDDRRIAKMDLSGVLRWTDLDGFLSMLKGGLSIDVAKTGSKDPGGALAFHLRWPSDPFRANSLIDALSRAGCGQPTEDPRSLRCARHRDAGTE